MKNTFMNINKVLLISIFVLTAACAKSTKEMVDKQQEIVNNTPLPSDDEPLPNDGSSLPPQPTPMAQPVSVTSAMSCQLTLLPQLVSVSNSGSYPVGLELGSSEHCVGQLPSGERRDDLSETVGFPKSNLVAQVSIRLVSPEHEKKDYHSTYKAQFYTLQNDQYVPVGQEQVYPLNLKLPSSHISSRIINNGQNKYLLICKARPSCVR